MSAYFETELAQHQQVLSALVREQGEVLERLVGIFVDAFRKGRKVLFFGNGGSAADSQHIAAEFINRFRYDRAPLPAIALTVDTSILTCIGNDASFEEIFSRQVQALTQPGDIVVGISTSGKSRNVLRALEVARAKEAVVVGFTGAKGREPMGPLCHHVLAVPSTDTARIQEGHEFAFHSIAARVEQIIFPAKP